MLKVTGITFLLALGLAMAGCGSGTTSGGNINGNWTATLANPNGSTFSQFSATFTVGTGGVLNIGNLTFTTPGPCEFSGAWGAGGSYTPNGTFGMSMEAENVGGPILILQGTLRSSKISGVWSASGVLPPCGGNGTFTIQPAAAG